MAREGRIVSPGQAAGHIVASTGSSGHWGPAVDSRAILDRYRIGINDAANGIAVGHPRPHNEMHTGQFHRNVRDRLQGVVQAMTQQGRGDRAIRRALRRELRAIGSGCRV
ncbi:AHH domain-containing protein [Xanthomonas translucens]|nr:AHH domain-containing protein [Xanthomonas translucens]